MLIMLGLVFLTCGRGVRVCKGLHVHCGDDDRIRVVRSAVCIQVLEALGIRDVHNHWKEHLVAA